MPTWTTYKNLTVPSTTTGDAGGYLKGDLESLADSAPFQSNSNPGASDDTNAGFSPGSFWLNTANGLYWICYDSTASAAKWRAFIKPSEDGFILAPTAGVGGTNTQGICIGDTNASTAELSISGGNYSKAYLRGQWARAAGAFNNQLGTAQTTITQLFCRTTNAAATEMTLDGNAPGSANRYFIQNNQTISLFVNIVGRKETTGGVRNGAFLRQALVQRTPTLTSVVSSSTLGTDINAGGWGPIVIDADNTNAALKIEVKGLATTNIRWAATVIATCVADDAI